MSISKTLFGTTRSIPEIDETGWGAEVTGILEDLCDGLDSITIPLDDGTFITKVSSTATTLASNASLSPTKLCHIVTGSGGAVTLNGTTAIVDGESGQRLLLIGGSDTNTVTILHGANTAMQGAICLALNEAIEFFFNGTTWIEVGRST